MHKAVKIVGVGLVGIYILGLNLELVKTRTKLIKALYTTVRIVELNNVIWDEIQDQHPDFMRTERVQKALTKYQFYTIVTGTEDGI